jgi:hypothetical protein
MTYDTSQLGSFCLLLVEGSWGWLGADDQLLFPVVREGEIHEQVRCGKNRGRGEVGEVGKEE